MPVTLHLTSLFAAGLPSALFLASALAVGWWWRLRGAVGGCLRMRGLEPPAEGFGGVGGAEALNRFTEDRFPCSSRHGGLQSVVVGVGGRGDEHFLKVVEAVAPVWPARSRCPPHPAAELPQGGDGPIGRRQRGLGRRASSIGSWCGGGGGWD